MHNMKNHPWFCLSIKGHQPPMKANAYDKTHHKDTKLLNLTSNFTNKLMLAS